MRFRNQELMFFLSTGYNSLTDASLSGHFFPLRTHVYRRICSQRPLSGSLLSVWDRLISCEPVKVETDNRNFPGVQHVY